MLSNMNLMARKSWNTQYIKRETEVYRSPVTQLRLAGESMSTTTQPSNQVERIFLSMLSFKCITDHTT